jgi:hypothetical protein
MILHTMNIPDLPGDELSNEQLLAQLLKRLGAIPGLVETVKMQAQQILDLKNQLETLANQTRENVIEYLKRAPASKFKVDPKLKS